MFDFNFLLKIALSSGISRRYFVVNGFDGALTMLGLISGFIISGNVDIKVAVSAGLGATVALAISGFSSAYISESAEREKWLNELKAAMVTDLKESAHTKAARLVPVYIAFVNGLSPLLIGLFILLPLWLAHVGVFLVANPYFLSIGFAFIALFGLGAFIGNIGSNFWLWSALKTTVVGVVTVVVILILGRI